MSILDLALLKRQVRADDFSTDDARLQDCLDDAEDKVIMDTYRSLDELLAMGGGELPRPIRRAVLMLAAYWYDEGITAAEERRLEAVPYGISSLIFPFRKLVADVKK